MKRLASAVLGLAALNATAQYPDTRTFDLRIGQQRPHIYCLAQDAQQLIWAGSDVGVLRTDGERTDLLFRSDGATVTCLAPSGDLILAALSDGRLVRFEGERVVQVTRNTLFVKSPIRCMYWDGTRTWIGTYGAGLRSQTGDEIMSITAANGLPDDHVHAIAGFGPGRVAIATDLGIAICDSSGRVVGKFTESEGLPDNLVTTLQSDGKRGVWAGTDRGGVFHLSTSGVVNTAVTSWPYGPVLSVAAIDSMLYCSTASRGVIVFAMGNNIATYAPPASHLNDQAKPMQLMVGADGGIWWCDGSERLHRSDPRVLFAPEHEGLDLTGITAICADDSGRIWLATPNGVFGHYAGFPDKEHLLRLPIDVPRNTPVTSLHADPMGHVWVGTFGSGAYRVRVRTGGVVHYTMATGLSNDNVMAIADDADEGSGITWLATLSGLSKFKPDPDDATIGTMASVPTPGSGFLYDVIPWPGHGVFAATDGSGIVFVPMNGPARILHEDSINTAYSLCADAQGRVWAMGPGTGLCLIANGTLSFQRFGRGVAPFDGEMFAMASFAGEVVAVGQGGSAAFDPTAGHVVDLSQEFGLAGITAELNAACTDAYGALWVGTDRGLVRLRAVPRILSADVPTVITALRWANEPLPLSGAHELRHDQDFITIQFAGLRYTAPEHIRFEYRLKGYDKTVRTTRDREVSWSRLPHGEYEFELRAAFGGNPMPSTWTTLHFTILKPWWLRWWALTLGLLFVAITIIVLLRVRDDRIRYRDRMEKEKARFQLEALRSQVNPHFLFNSFNTLIGLIEEDKDKAVEHTEQLSDFFRNILQVRDKDLIPLSEELPLLNTYFKLEKQRFGARIALQVDIPSFALQSLIPPLTLQLLVENAIKHNRATDQDPLLIEVGATSDAIRVRNPFRPRTTATAGTGYGLESIRQRYQVLTDRPIQLEVTDSFFEVRIPLITQAP
ncbi:MAG: histidine kinase [Flavobacteriales bacterium]|nr:histidine kinase [Flavobacteriales bacterium]